MQYRRARVDRDRLSHDRKLHANDQDPQAPGHRIRLHRSATQYRESYFFVHRLRGLHRLTQRRMRQDQWWYRFEKTRERGRAIGFRTLVNIDRGINEMQLLLRTRRGDVEQSPLLIEIIKLILKAVRRKPTISHPDYEHVI